jgi:hypothetical protein
MVKASVEPVLLLGRHNLVGTQGYADDQSSRDAHTEEVREHAAQFIEAFIMRASEKHVIVYMHTMQCQCH